ncbi:hypothetical protein PINS_up007040 [Pythium insidiosum]|nr:hypothetical protein PINS_up007040 [Pythium insidiosum]
MEFPVKPDFFPAVRASPDERQRYVSRCEQSVQVLRKLVREDKWKRIQSSKGVTIGKVHCIEERSGEHRGPARACLVLCATIVTSGTVSEVLEALASPVTEDYRRAMAFLYKDQFLDGVCLHTLATRSPEALTTIKWLAMRESRGTTTLPLAQSIGGANPIVTIGGSGAGSMTGADYCFVEHSGLQREPDKPDAVFGFCVQESIVRDREVPAMPGLGLRRGELHRTGILVLPTDRKDIVQVSSILQMDTTPARSKAALEKLMIQRVSAVQRVPLWLDRRRLSRMQFIPRDEWIRDEDRKACVLCLKVFGLRRKHHCRKCGEVVCSVCAPPREVEIDNYGVANIRICQACMIRSRSSSETSSAAQEVLVCNVRSTLSSRASTQLYDDMTVADDGPEEPSKPRESESSDSNFSISSASPGHSESSLGSFTYDDGQDIDDYHHHQVHHHYEDDVYTRKHYQHHQHHHQPAPVYPFDGMAYRDSESYSCRSSGLSFSDLNTLEEDALRITSVTSKPSTKILDMSKLPARREDAENKAPPNASSIPPFYPNSRMYAGRDRMSSLGDRSERDSKRSSSGSSSSSLLEILASIQDIKMELPRVQSNRSLDPQQRFLDRLSEQSQPREPELPDHSALTDSRPLHESDSGSSVSTIDIEMFNSDSFSLLCPATLQRERFSSGNQEAGDRRTRVSALSDLTTFEDDDEDDDDSDDEGGNNYQQVDRQRHPRASSTRRQSELLTLRQQVEDLRRSLEDATKKLNVFEACAAVQQHVGTLEREVVELESTERRQRKRAKSKVVDPVVAERKQLYRSLISELHDIMGLPALDAIRTGAAGGS